MKKKLPVSVMILTKNEEANLPGCLASVAWAAQILVVDCYSTDRTVAIAKKAAAKVVLHAWPGYTAQRNFALSRCRQPWVLLVDADERAAPDLEEAIREELARGPAYDAYRVSEVNDYYGRWLKHGGVYPGRTVIFFKRQGARFENNGQADIHERLILGPGAKRGDLGGHIIHHAYPSMDLGLDKLNHYTSLEAEGRVARGGKASLYGLFWRPLERFLKNYILKAGFLDGVQGLLYCFQTGYYTFVFQLKMWERQAQKDA
jgi:glycosyltransferase involved in cell wall biosynthesis